MLSLADTTDLLARTTTCLTEESAMLLPRAGVALIDAWLEPLEEGENTQPLTGELAGLKSLLATNPVDEQAVQSTLASLAGQLSLFSSQLGTEGEMPGLLEGLATALRQAAESSRADTGG